MLSGQLLFLEGADPPGRVEDDHVDVPSVVEGRRHGAPGVAAGGHEDHGLAIRLGQELLHGRRQKGDLKRHFAKGHFDIHFIRIEGLVPGH